MTGIKSNDSVHFNGLLLLAPKFISERYWSWEQNETAVLFVRDEGRSLYLDRRSLYLDRRSPTTYLTNDLGLL